MTLLEKGRRDEAIAAARRAADLDQVDAFASLPQAVTAFAAAFDEGMVGIDAIAALKAAVGPGPLAGRVEKLSPRWADREESW